MRHKCGSSPKHVCQTPIHGLCLGLAGVRGAVDSAELQLPTPSRSAQQPGQMGLILLSAGTSRDRGRSLQTRAMQT